MPATRKKQIKTTFIWCSREKFKFGQKSDMHWKCINKYEKSHTTGYPYKCLANYQK